MRPLCPRMGSAGGRPGDVCAKSAQPPPPPEQPIPFSHKAHAGDLKLPCKMCHKSPDPGEMMGFVPPPVCMQCHSAIKTDSPAIQKLAAAARENREIRWARVYEIPLFVAFSHRYHQEGGVSCQECHGPRRRTRSALPRRRHLDERLHELPSRQTRSAIAATSVTIPAKDRPHPQTSAHPVPPGMNRHWQK